MDIPSHGKWGGGNRKEEVKRCREKSKKKPFSLLVNKPPPEDKDGEKVNRKEKNVKEEGIHMETCLSFGKSNGGGALPQKEEK